MEQQQVITTTDTTTTTSTIYQHLTNPANRWSPPPSPLPERPTNQWSPSPPGTPPISTTASQNLTSSTQPCTPIDLADIEQSELLLETIESDDSIASLTNTNNPPITAINNILQDVVNHYNQVNNTSFTTTNQIIQHNVEMTSEQPSPIPTNTGNIPTSTIQTNPQTTPIPVFTQYVPITNPPIPTPLLTPSLLRGFTPVTHTNLSTFIPINQLPHILQINQ